MTRPADIGQLNTTNWDQLEKLADRFEKAWRQAAAGADPPDLAGFLPGPADPMRSVVLHELIKVEMEARWRLGQPTSLETYLARFPEIGGPKDVPATLIFEEYRVRQLYGDKPALTVYQGRFPGQFAELKKLHEDNPQPTVTLPPGTKANIPTPPPPKGAPSPPVAAAAKVQGTQAQVATAAVSMGTTTVMDDYTLIKRIGSGTFGEVWKAEAPGGVPVAVKIVIRPVDHEEAQREMAAMELIKQLQHPFLLQTHRFKPVGERLMIVMELADGSLRDRAKQRRKEGKPGIPPAELVRYFKESAEALDFLHQNKVLHRDIKPENILLLKGHAKVADFGLARTGGAGASMFSATGCGTPAYMAPEVWRGKAAEATDQYSLAVAYAELRLDRRLFTGTDFAQLMFAHLENTPDLSPLPEDEQKVILKAISKEPSKRYKTCQEFTEALEDALADLIRKPTPSTAHLRAPSHSAQNLSAVQGTDAMGTVGRQPLPSRVASQGTEAWREEKKSGSTATTVLLLFLLAGLGYGGWRIFGAKENGPNPTAPLTKSFKLRDIEAVGIHVGEKKRVTLHIDRANFPDPVELSFTGVPSHLTITPADSKVAGDSVFLDIVVGDQVEPNEYTPTVHAVAGDEKQSKEFCVNVLPLETLPPGCKPAPGTKLLADISGKKYYQRVLLEKAGLQVAFVAVTKNQAAEPPTFYMMENKATNQLMLAASKDRPFLDLLDRESKKSKDLVRGEWQDKGALAGGKPLGSGNLQLPVMRVTVTEALCLAEWLGGQLPTEEQWDNAAGLREKNRGEGPYQGIWLKLTPAEKKQIAVDRNAEGPMPVDQPTLDISLFGCRHMSGNGREWTRNANQDRRIPLISPGSGDSVKVRGVNYAEPEPLRFGDLLRTPESSFYIPRADQQEPKPDIGCRVVLELQ